MELKYSIQQAAVIVGVLALVSITVVAQEMHAGLRSAERQLDTLLTLTRPRLATSQGTICATSQSQSLTDTSSDHRPDSGETAVFLLNGLLLAVGLQLEQRKMWLQHSAGVPLMFLGAGEDETEMDSNYVFLCGVMWCRFGQQDAGKELLRATNSVDPDMKSTGLGYVG